MSMGVCHRMTHQDFHALCPNRLDQIGFGRTARIDNRLNAGPCCQQIQCGAIGIVIIGENHCAAARQHTKVIDIGAHSTGQHDAGAVIIAKYQGLFQRACRQHNLLGADLPPALARQVVRRHREVIGDFFDAAD